MTSVEGGTQSVPVSIPTGRAGPATTHTKTRDAAIPDDNAGGVVSTLFVPISGRIKDLDVRINSIDHSFVGDLKVELVSPDNSTTVRLIEHVGGPNNGGDDLVDTVFDDEAPTVIGVGGTPRRTPAASARRATSSRASTARSSRAHGSSA